MPPHSKKTVLLPTESSVVRISSWAGMSEGDPVKVTAPILDGKRGYSWVFRCYATNTLTGSTWVEVYGGDDHLSTRAFRPSEVTLIPKKRDGRRRDT